MCSTQMNSHLIPCKCLHNKTGNMFDGVQNWTRCMFRWFWGKMLRICPIFHGFFLFQGPFQTPPTRWIENPPSRFCIKLCKSLNTLVYRKAVSRFTIHPFGDNCWVVAEPLSWDRHTFYWAAYQHTFFPWFHDKILHKSNRPRPQPVLPSVESKMFISFNT